MSKFFLPFFAIALSLTSLAQVTPEEVAKFILEKKDLGQIKQGTPVTYFFEITNTSKQPLIVEKTWGSCGCTTPDLIKEPIMPGKSAKLKVVYNAAAIGHFSKDINIKLAGISQVKSLIITGQVLTAEAYEKGKKQN